ncbi:hypothetical protein, partial [Ligilactobacillus ruminis]
HLMVMVCCNRFTSLSSYINYIILIWEKSGKGKGKKEAPQVLERGFPPITKVTGFQPIYLSMKIQCMALNRQRAPEKSAILSKD